MCCRGLILFVCLCRTGATPRTRRVPPAQRKSNKENNGAGAAATTLPPTRGVTQRGARFRGARCWWVGGWVVQAKGSGRCVGAVKGRRFGDMESLKRSGSDASNPARHRHVGGAAAAAGHGQQKVAAVARPPGPAATPAVAFTNPCSSAATSCALDSCSPSTARPDDGPRTPLRGTARHCEMQAGRYGPAKPSSRNHRNCGRCLSARSPSTESLRHVERATQRRSDALRAS